MPDVIQRPQEEINQGLREPGLREMSLAKFDIAKRPVTQVEKTVETGGNIEAEIGKGETGIETDQVKIAEPVKAETNLPTGEGSNMSNGDIAKNEAIKPEVDDSKSADGLERKIAQIKQLPEDKLTTDAVGEFSNRIAAERKRIQELDKKKN